tara:strand:+ start:18277 stop:18981 length:705 start_codon:yes stop_codon:yes gene_type:complete
MVTIFHLHIPRTAGSSLDRLLSLKVGRDVLHSNDAAEIAKIQRDMPHAFVTGHYSWGAHVTTPDHVYFIVLREPVARVWSVYRYVLSQPEHPKFKVWGDKSFAEILATPKFRGIQMSNAQVRQIAGTPVDRSVGLVEFLRAVRNLCRANVVIGLPETLTKDVVYLSRKAGFAFASDVPMVNQAPEAEMDAVSRKLAMRLNRYDTALYHWARLVRAIKVRQYERIAKSVGMPPSP